MSNDEVRTLHNEINGEVVCMGHKHIEKEETLTQPSNGKEVFTKNTFLCDTRASCHLTNSLEGMTDLIECPADVRIGNGAPMKS